LMSSGVYQRGDEDEGIYGFLVEDIKREIRRSSRLVILQRTLSHSNKFSTILSQHSAVMFYLLGHQAYSAALFFFRCTICNNKDKFQQEMLRMGIHIPERDASWELEENAYGELLQVYQRCDALKCISHKGRKYSTQEGSSLQRNTPGEILHTLASQISKHQFMSVVVRKDGVFKAALELLRQADFDPHHSLKVTFPDDEEQTNDMNNGNLQRFLRLLIQDLQNSVLFEGPENKKNLALNSQAVQEDFYFDAGCIIALSLIHGGPPLGFFSEALYKCLFNFPRDSHLTVEDMGESLCAAKIRDAQSVKDLKKAVSSASDYLEVAGCLRQINSLSDKQPLVKDIVNFHLVTRMQLPLKRFRDGLNTLGLFEHIQMFPEIFSDLFCYPPAKISAHTMANLFFVQFSDNEEKKKKEIITEGFWRQYLHDCEEGRCATSLEDILIFATSKDIVPAMGFNPNPSVSFVHSLSSVGTVPERQPCYNKIVLPVATTYEIFKKHLEYAVCQYTLMQTI
ncbi:G2/M phase-specific E3 ubiquitin-protein ligase-like, partial [Scleropages formosus]